MNKNKKQKIIGIISLLVILYFSTVNLYDELYAQYGDIKIPRRTSYEKGGASKKYTETILDTKGNVVAQVGENENIRLDLHALSAALIDASNGRVLYEKAGFNQVPMASTTKIMTCIVALEYGKLDDIVTISRYAASMPDVQLNVMPGETYILKDLLYSLMLESHNDVSVAIAEHIGGSVEGFAKLMNEKAKELGCVNTNFVTPNGLDAPGHLTTAVELSKIAAYAIKNPDFIDITNTATWTIREQAKGKVHQVNNKDRFLLMYDGAIGVKTGFTNKAGFCFVGAVKKNGKTFVSSVLASGWPPNKSYKWQDTTRLMNYGMNNYQMSEIFYDEKIFEPVKVYEGMEQSVDVTYTDEISLLMRDDEYVKVIYELPQYVVAPIYEKNIIGVAKYYVDNELYKEVPIYTTKSIEGINFEYCIKKIISIWSH